MNNKITNVITIASGAKNYENEEDMIKASKLTEEEKKIALETHNKMFKILVLFVVIELIIFIPILFYSFITFQNYASVIIPFILYLLILIAYYYLQRLIFPNWYKY